MAGQSSAMFGWSWTEVSVLGSQVFGQALMESCEVQNIFILNFLTKLVRLNVEFFLHIFVV